MKKYLICLDLDGTTIPNLYDIGDYTVRVFKKLNELGHKIVIITGRPFRSSYFVYYKMGLDTPIVNYNGCLITNPSDKSYESFSYMMKKSDLLDVYNNTKGFYKQFFVESYDHVYTDVDIENIRELMHLNSMSTLFVGDLNKIIDTDIHGSLVIAKEGCGEKIVEYVKRNFTDIDARIWSFGSYKEIVEIFSTKYHKGNALLKVMKDLNFTIDDCINCGDSPNDIDSFKLGGLTIAPANACDEIKKIASIVLTKDCKEEGIADYFNERFNLGIKR